jgi:hypothetical protein
MFWLHLLLPDSNMLGGWSLPVAPVDVLSIIERLGGYPKTTDIQTAKLIFI